MRELPVAACAKHTYRLPVRFPQRKVGRDAALLQFPKVSHVAVVSLFNAIVQDVHIAAAD